MVALASLLVLGGAVIWRVSVSRPPEQAQAVAPPRDPMLGHLVENTKALEDSQQQAIDQLQVLQDLVRAQQAETKIGIRSRRGAERAARCAAAVLRQHRPAVAG